MLVPMTHVVTIKLEGEILQILQEGEQGGGGGKSSEEEAESIGEGDSRARAGGMGRRKGERG